jgi:hypothetical protein
MTSDPQVAPLDLPQLRLWIARMIENYEKIIESKILFTYSEKEIKTYHKALLALGRTCSGAPKGPSKDRVRELLASGALYYGLQSKPPEQLIPEQVVIDFSVFALWPLVVAPKPPKDWIIALQEITGSMPLVRLVIHARFSLGTSEPLNAQQFGQVLSQAWFAPAILNLLNDFADPQKGGCALTAVAIASTGRAPRQDRGISPREIAKWALVTAVAGVIGNRADDALTIVYDWLYDAASRPPTRPHGQYIPPVPGTGKAHQHKPGRDEDMSRLMGAVPSGIIWGAGESEHTMHAIESIFKLF